MKLGLIKIKRLLSRDKRKTERLILGGNLWYRLGFSQKWTGPLPIENISGGGINFRYKKSFKKNTVINLMISFLGENEPIIVKGKVTWCKAMTPRKTLNNEVLPGGYKTGVKFFKMDYNDRRKFIDYFSEKVITKYLDAEGRMESEK